MNKFLAAAAVVLALGACAHREEVNAPPPDPCGSKLFWPGYVACRASLTVQNTNDQQTARECLRSGQANTAFCQSVLNKGQMR